MAPTRMIFLAIILFTWGTIEALEHNLWIPNFAKNAENSFEKNLIKLAENPPVGLKRILPFKKPKEFNSSGIIPKKLRYGQAIMNCGSYTLAPGDTAIIRSKNYPNKFPKWQRCQWEFRASSPDSRMWMFCPVFRLSWWWFFSFVEVEGGDFYSIYFGNRDGLSASSTTSHMKIVFKSRWGTEKGFECYVTASVLPTFPFDDCKCGHVNTIKRIVGGKPTEVHEYPWQVALTPANSNRPYCGGSLISDQWIVTAAHCVKGESPSNNRIVIGEHNWNSNSETTVTERREISQIEIHPNYNSTKHVDNDIALVKLKSPIQFSTDNKIAPVCLPPPGDLYENVEAIVTGWGNLSSVGPQPDELYKLKVSTLPNKQCISRLGILGKYITMTEICAGGNVGKDFCKGDSGGPLVTAGDASQKFMVQIGVVSWYRGSCAIGYPSVYARVNKHLDWIAITTTGSTTCPSRIIHPWAPHPDLRV